MDVHYLLKDELEFELACRGIQDITTVTPMRKILKELLHQESEGQSKIKLTVPEACDSDPLGQISICEKKLAVLSATLQEIVGYPDRHTIKRLSSRLLHLQGRIKLMVPLDTILKTRQAKVVSSIESCLKQLESVRVSDLESEDISEKDKETLHKSLGEEAIKIIKKLQIEDVMLSHEPKMTSESEQYERPGMSVQSPKSYDAISTQTHRKPLQRTSTVDNEFHLRKLVPIKDWGIKFTGKGEMSVNAFLERVEELKDARNARNEDLYRYAIDFFEGDALIWYRAIRNEIREWGELVQRLLSTFQKPYYQEELMEEIKKRTQGRTENVTIYIAFMQNMFNRLPEKLSEKQKLGILLKNIQPYFQRAVCRDEFTSVAELTKILVILERTKVNCDNFVEPTNTINALEPDLAYQDSSEEINAISRQTSRANPVATSERKCWNCRSVGHTFRNCHLPRQRLFCYKCGKFGETTTKCTCLKSGNAYTGAATSAVRPPQ